MSDAPGRSSSVGSISAMTIARRTFAGLLLIVAVALASPRAASAIPKIITVCASGCDFTSINAAANDPGTNAGDSIDVMAGTYTEQVSVPKQLNIFGAGGGPRPVVTSAATNGITFTVAAGGTGTSLEHLDIRATGSNANGLKAQGAVNATDLALSGTASCAWLLAGTPSQLGPNVTASGTDPGGTCVTAGSNAADSLTGLTVNAVGVGVGLFHGTLTDSTVNADVALELASGVVRRATLNGNTEGAHWVDLGQPGSISDSVVTASLAAIIAEPFTSSISHILTLRNVTAYAGGSSSDGLFAEQGLGGGNPGAVIDARNLIARGASVDVLAGTCTTGSCSPGQITIGYSNFRTTFGLVDTGSVGHNESADPLLVNPVVGPGQDFHIACSGSPVIGAGVADAANGPTDRDGVNHPNPPSIGAYEFTGSAPCPTTAAGPTAAGPTGLRAAALKKCKKKHSARKRRKCRKRARLLPA